LEKESIMNAVSYVKVALVACLPLAAMAQVSEAVLAEAKAAIAKGTKYLVSVQKESGGFSDEQFPALTALPLWALAGSGDAGLAGAADKAAGFVASKAQPDGGIYVPIPGRKGGGLGNYNTSVCVTALHATGKKDFTRIILNARSYIASSQFEMEGIHQGGFGYDKASGRAYSDLLNTAFAADAMRRTQGVEESRPAGEKKADINWDAALKYAEKLQSKEGEQKGGFVYNPVDPKAGVGTNKTGRVRINAYGSITYSGLLTMLHAKLERSDPRVKSAFEYLGKFWTLEENPGVGQQGLYFYYTIIARALVAAESDAELKKDGALIPWRELLIKKLVSLQKPDGSWANENNRWWENDPVLASSYALIALEFAAGLAR